MSKIDRVDDLPAWFKLEKYQGCEKFRAAEWLEQVYRRHLLMTVHPDWSSYINPDWRDFALELWRANRCPDAQKIREAPLDSPSNGKMAELMADQDSQPIRSICLFDLFCQASRDLQAERDGKAPSGHGQRWDMTSPLKDFLIHARAPLSINFYNEGVAHPIIEVDLGASDAVLKEAFSRWLRRARESSMAPTATRSRALYDRWARYGLLPYLDLLIWSIETDIHIPDRVMSAAISHYDAGEANLRKTVAPLAKGLLRDFSELQALAAVESTVQASANQETFSD